LADEDLLRNLVKYVGGDDSGRDLERYLEANKLL